MQEKVLIISDDPEFRGAILRSLQCVGPVPESAVVRPDRLDGCPLNRVAVLDGAKALPLLPDEVSLVVVVTDGEAMPELVDAGRRVVQLRRGTGWTEIAAALALENILGERALRQVEEMEELLCGTKRFSTLGKFIAGQQHELANALTSLMGHAELLMTQRDVPDDVQRKIGTVHAMSLRICDVLQQLSSLDRELQMTERLGMQKKLDEQAANAAS